MLSMLTETSAPYDRLYEARPDGILWGAAPGRLVERISEWMTGGTVLDAGCGDGKNAVALERAGFRVVGVDKSRVAIEALRGRFAATGANPRGVYMVGDVARDEISEAREVDLLVSYGLYHCLPFAERQRIHISLQERVVPGGLVIFASLMSDISLPPDHGTADIELAREHEIDRLFCGWTLVYREHGKIREDHLPVVREHEHAVSWVVARRPVR